MAVTMDLEESASDSKLHKDSAAKKEFRPSSAVSVSKSEHGPGSFAPGLGIRVTTSISELFILTIPTSVKISNLQQA